MGNLTVKKGEVIIREHNPERLKTIRDSLITAIQLCEAKGKCIELLSNANKSDDFVEKDLLCELVDASILARRNNAVVLTDDYLYLKTAEVSLGYKEQLYVSSVALVRAMYLLGYVSFKEYIGYFGFASSYRFRFLPVFPLDVEKAVLGDELIKDIHARNIEYFNFKLTLSEEYGVSAEECARVLSVIFINFILDNSLTGDIFERIIIEIMNSLPDSQNKIAMIDRIQSKCETNLRNKQEMGAIHLNYSIIRTKLSQLKSVRSIYV